jgi:hypothetical protein
MRTNDAVLTSKSESQSKSTTNQTEDPKNIVILRKTKLPKQLSPDELPYTFKFTGNGKIYRIITTPFNGLQMIRPY